MSEVTTDTQVTELWTHYQHGLAYQASCKLSKKLPQFVDFYEGKQWPDVTPNTKNMPRPVINIVKMICRSKKSAILSTPVKIVYHAEMEGVDVDRFNRFSDYIQKELGQEALDKKAIDDGVKKGSYFYHYYWDAEAKGKDGITEGGLRCEIIDPLSIFFADPTELDEQKQEWILIVSRENVKSVRAKCDPDVDPESITADKAESKYGTIEQDGDELCTVLIRYFRKDGEVYCEKATKSVVINKPFSITPDITAAEADLFGEDGTVEEDAPNNALPDSADGESIIPDDTRACLYPIVVGNYEVREHSIYGLGEVEGLIPNQKSINFLLAMTIFNSQELAWGKYVVAPNALKGQTITNEPGQVLVDHTGTGNGIRKMTEQTMQGQPMQLVDSLTQLTRVVTGATEVMTGETLGAGMSGAAIAQLQSQALQPVEELKQTFWLVKEKQGRVLAQFFKLYYEDKEFTYVEDESIEGDKQKRLQETFNSSDFRGVEFSVVVEATAGTNASAAGDINMLDVLFSKGAISLRTYIQAYPQDALTNRTKLARLVEAEEASQIARLNEQMKQAMQRIEQQDAIIKQQSAAVDQVDALVNENLRLKKMILQMRTEATQKIMQANEQIRVGNARVAETTQDASEMAQALYAGGLYRDSNGDTQ